MTDCECNWYRTTQWGINGNMYYGARRADVERNCVTETTRRNAVRLTKRVAHVVEAMATQIQTHRSHAWVPSAVSFLQFLRLVLVLIDYDDVIPVNTRTSRVGNKSVCQCCLLSAARGRVHTPMPPNGDVCNVGRCIQLIHTHAHSRAHTQAHIHSHANTTRKHARTL